VTDVAALLKRLTLSCARHPATAGRRIEMDVARPRMDGESVIRRIRDEETRDVADRHLWVAAVTGVGELETGHRLREAGLDDILEEPLMPAALDGVLRAAAGRRCAR